MLMQKGIGQYVIAPEEQGRDEGNSHDRGIREQALLIIPVLQGHEQIGAEAIDGYNMVVHEAGS